MIKELKYACADCGSVIKHNQKKCKKCWAELVWNTDDKNTDSSKKKVNIFEKIQNNGWLLLLTMLAVFILPGVLVFLWVLIEDAIGGNINIVGWFIAAWFIIWLPITIVWICLWIKNMGFRSEDIWEYGKNILRYWLVIIIWWLLLYRTRWMSFSDVGLSIIWFLREIRWILLLIIWVLLLIYLIVKFIKRCRNH